jgi:pimeloyl-ACP methyl ester carboxylesterase
LAYAVRGNGPPVVFIQGVGVHGDGWLPQVDVLAAHYCCLWFDNRGVGRSQPGTQGLSVELMAEDAAALITAQGWPTAHVVGHSMGGLIAIRLALTAPARVRSLALLCTFARGRDAGASPRMVWLGLRSRIGTRRMRRHAFLEIVAPPQALVSDDRDRMAERLAPVFGHDLADHPAGEMRQLAALWACDATPELPRLAGIPTLVVSAEHDPISPPPIGASLARGIPGARYTLLPNASHGAPILSPEKINPLLLEHLAHADRQ